MPDDTFKRLLIKLGISTSDFKVAVNEIKKQLDTVNAKAKADAVSMKVTQQEQLNLTKQQIADQQRLTAEAKSMAAVDQAKASWEKKNQEALQTKIKQRILETTELKKQQVQAENTFKLEQERVKLQQKQYQLSLQQTKETERQIRLQTTGSAIGGGGILGGIGKFASGLAGGGLLGSIIGGTFIGTGLEQAVSGVTDRVRRLADALLEASGPAQTLRAEFERLAIRKGADPTELLEKLRSSTRGLVSDVELFKVANNFLKSGMKVTTDQMQLLITNTINLGRTMGKTGPEVGKALELAFLNPQRGMMRLAQVTGINREVMMQHIRGISPALDATTRATLMFNAVLAEEEKMLKRVGVPATTLPELITQIGNAEHNFIDEMAHGILTGSGFGNTINDISKRLIAFGPRLDVIAKSIGEKLANAFKFLSEHWGDIKLLGEALIGLKLTEWALEGTSAFLNWSTAAIKLASSLELIKAAEVGIAAARGTEIISTDINLANSAGASAAGSLLGRGIGKVAGGVAAAGGGSVVAGLAAVTAILGTIYLAVNAYFEFRKQGTGFMPKGPAGLRKDTLASSGTAGSLYYDDYLFNEQLPQQRAKTLAPPAIAYKGRDKSQRKKDDDEETEETIQAIKQRQQLELQTEKELAQLRLSIRLEELKGEEQAVKNSYTQGLISLEDEIIKERLIAAKEHKAKLDDIEQERVAKIKQLRESAVTSHLPANLLTKQEEVANLASKEKIEKENTSFDQAEFQRSQTLLNDKESAYRTYVDGINKINLQGVQERIFVLENEFKQGNVGADDYINTRKTLIQEELTLTLQGLDAKKEAAKNNASELAKIATDEATARIKADKDITTVDLQQNDIRLQLLETHYDKAKKYLEIEQQIAKNTPGGDAQGRELAIAKALYSITTQYIEQQKILLNQTEQGSKDWMAISEHIASATEEEYKLNLQMAQLKDLSGPLGGLFGSIAGLLGEFKNTQGIVSLLGKMESSMEKLSKFSIEINKSGGAGNYFKDIGSSIAGIFHKGGGSSAAKTAQQIFDESLGKSSDTMSVMDKQTLATAKALAELETKAQELYKEIHTGTANVPLQSAQNPSFNVTEGVPTFQFGGTVNQTGLIHAHQGEEIITPGQVGLLNQFISGVSRFGNAIETLVGKLLTLSTTVDTHKNVGVLGATSTALSSIPKLNAPTMFSGSTDTFVQRLSPIAQEKTASFTPSSSSGNVFSSLTFPIKTLAEAFATLGTSADSTASKLGGIKPGDATPGGGTASSNDDDEAGSSGGSSMSAVMGKMQGLLGGIQGLVQGLTAGKNAAGGAASGGMAGMQFGANFGPIGAAVGLVGGAGIGAIFGNKEAHLTADLKAIQVQMQSIIDSMNAGTISLSQTIADLRKERQQAIAMLSGNKKGDKSKKGQPSQIQQAIAAIDQEIAQLVNEQTQILQNLTSSLITLSQPIQFQQYLTSLNQIIQQYQQFASAAVGNTQEVANANQFLNLSLQNYVTTLSQNLNQAQQQAIQDALTLINLEYQRQQLMNQTAQQEYDILTQGVLTRQRTTAMTKGQEIGQIEYQRDMQLEQMNEEIALSQAKVDAETKIFGLANTRIGLENQLLAAQEEAANYQIAQVLALSQVVQDLTSGLSSGQIMQQLEGMMQGGAMPTGSGLLMLLAQLLGLGGNVPPGELGGQYGTQNWLEQIPQQWQGAAQYVSEQNPNFYNDFEAAAGSVPYSTERSAAEADVQPLLTQGKTEGYDMQGFYQWLQSGQIPSLQSLQTGGPVAETGPILAHEGEYMLNASDVSSLKSLLTNINNGSSNDITPVISSLTDAVTILANGLTNNLATGSLGTSNRAGGGGIISAGLTGLNQLSTMFTNAMIAAFKNIPSFDAGGTVPGTGPVPIIAHGGETITPVSGTASGPNTSALGVSSQTTMLNLTRQRTTLEMTVISARQQQMQVEIQYLSQLSAILDQIQNGNANSGTNSGPSNLEGMFAKVYENRGRQGSGNFRRNAP